MQTAGNGTVVLAQAVGADLLNSPLVPLVLLVVLYFVLIRPQTKRRKELAKLVASIGVGDLIATIGGIHGVVVELDAATVDLAVTEDAQGRPDVIVRFDRNAVARVIERAGDDADAPADGSSD